MGGAVFVLLLPWGDPCSFAGGQCDASDTVRNIVFDAICVLIGLTGGLRCRPVWALWVVSYRATFAYLRGRAGREADHCATQPA